MKLLALIILLYPFYEDTCSADTFQTKDRGAVYEYDSGAPKDSKWTDLFASTPNYRAIGKKIISGYGEKFRWKMGPMFYRGRLTSNSVKVFIIGQEGAQDENLSNRSFTGSTGTRMQKFLNYLGITQSYLFMNTFVYTITGQYSLYGEDAQNEYKKKQWKQLMWLAQNKDSIVVQHRHRMFNYMLETNKKTLSLIIGVGTAGKESTVTWMNSISPGSCSYRKLTSSFCEGQGQLNGVIAIGLRHPGAASARNAGGGATSGLIYDFKKKAKTIAGFIQNNGDWLKKDSDGTRNFNKEFKYGYASIPHRDFAFGTPWTLGKRGTTSNRRGSDTIQIFSSNGCYNNGARVGRRCLGLPPNQRPSGNSPDERIHYLKYKNPRNLIRKTEVPLGFYEEDLPFEPPKNVITRYQYDQGPGLKLAPLMLDYYMKTVQSQYSSEIIQDLSIGHTGIYRGNTKNPSFLIIADQQGHTDMFSGRALTGTAGQKLQAFIDGAGLQNQYLIIRTLPVDCLDDTTKEIVCDRLLQDKNVTNSRNSLIKKVIDSSNIEFILSFGKNAKKIVKKLDVDKTIYHISPGENNLDNALSELFFKIKKDTTLKISSNYKKFKIRAIPRKDLPFSARWWMGTSGDRASRSINMKNLVVQNGVVRQYDLGSPNGNYYKVYAPSWASNWDSDKVGLTKEEIKSIKKFKETGL